MLNKNSVKQLKGYKYGNNLYKPHPEYNIKNILKGIYSSFGILDEKHTYCDMYGKEGIYDNVVLILLDGLSYYLYEKYSKELKPHIKKYIEEKVLISKITSIFPPTTTSVIPFFHTGYLPEESGLYEWWQYEHNTQKVICPFTYRYIQGREQRDMSELGIDPKSIYMESRFNKRLIKNGVKISSFTRKYTTPFNVIANEGVNIYEGSSFEDSCRDFKNTQFKGKNFIFIYNPDIDYIEHTYGVDSSEVKGKVISILNQIYDLLESIDNGLVSNCKVFITADHGLTDVDYNKDFVFLDEQIEDIHRYMKTNDLGEIICIGGSPRDAILHIKEECLDDFISIAKRVVRGKAEIFTKNQLIIDGIFNNDIHMSESFRLNMGNVLILPYDGNGIWFREDLSKYRAYHGGLSEKELHIPLLVYNNSL